MNEELISLSLAGNSTIPSTPLQSGYATPIPAHFNTPAAVSAPCAPDSIFAPSFLPASIESFDGAILCYGATEAGHIQTGLISASPPFGLINGIGIQNSGLPPPFPPHLVSQVTRVIIK